MEQLKVRNFGAIKEADIDIKKYNILIGHTSSGKSIIAKLLSIFNNHSFWSTLDGDFTAFLRLLEKYNINFPFNDSTLILYQKDSYYWEIKKDHFHSNYNDADLISSATSEDSYDFILKFIDKKSQDNNFSELIKSLRKITSKESESFDKKDPFYTDFVKPILLGVIYDKCTPVYIPAERILISIFSNNIFSLLQAGTNIPQCIKDFGSLYEKARNINKSIDIDIMNIKIVFSNEEDYVILKNNDEKIKLTQASSGIQSIIPLWTVFNQFASNKEKQILVIEEPELNLFPISQVYLIDWIIKKMRKSKGKIVITTHSPYVLSTIDNLIFGYKILAETKDKKTTVAKKIKEIIPSWSLVNFKEVSSYFFSSDGIVKPIKDNDLKTIGAEYIDEASDILSFTFNELCKLEDHEL